MPLNDKQRRILEQQEGSLYKDRIGTIPAGMVRRAADKVMTGPSAGRSVPSTNEQIALNLLTEMIADEDKAPAAYDDIAEMLNRVGMGGSVEIIYGIIEQEKSHKVWLEKIREELNKRIQERR